MSLIYLTPKILPFGRSRYACYDPDASLYDFGNDLHVLDPYNESHRLSKSNWNLTYSNFDEFVNHPDIICFTKQSHPEYFI